MTSSWGGARYAAPMAFTEHRAIEVNIAIMRAFVKLRELISAQSKVADKLADLKKRLTAHDENFQVVFEAIRQLLETDEAPKRKIGF